MGHKSERAAPAGTGSGSQNASLRGASGTDDNSKLSGAQVIGYVTKNSRERIRVALDSFKNHHYCDVRIFVASENGEKATKAGVTIRPDRIAELRALLVIAEAEAKTAGLIVGGADE